MSRTPMSILLGLLSVLFRAIPTLNLTIALLFVTRYPWKGYSFDSYSCFLMCWTLVILRRQQDCLGLLYLKLRSLGCFFLDLIRSILIAFLASTPWPTAMWHPKSHLLFPERSTRHRLEHTQDAWHIWIPALSDSIKTICFFNSYYSVYCTVAESTCQMKW